jgi:hypothetical protein
MSAGYIVIGVERLREPMQKITNFIKQHAGIDKRLSSHGHET